MISDYNKAIPGVEIDGSPVSAKLQGNAYVSLVCLTAGFGGFLFGFDTAVISGAINFLRAQFQLSAVMEGWLMSSALLGCVLGALAAGYLSDKYGRRKILIASAVLFIVSAAGCALAQDPGTLVLARIIGGIGVGFAAMVAPMFISELSPARLRGRLVSFYQLAITLGILCSYLSNFFLLQHARVAVGSHAGFLHYYLVDEAWRGMLGSNIVPALIFFIFLLFVPESPRWLAKEGRTAEAGKILERISGKDRARSELSEIEEDIAEEQSGSFRQLLGPGIRLALIIGIALPFLSQLSGITTVMYYAPAIFEQAGLGSGSAMGGSAVIGVFNMAFTFLAIWKIDKWGRKPLLICGFTGLSVALLLIGTVFIKGGDAGRFLLPSFIYYIAVFAATLGPGVWVVIAEIYPTNIRGRAMSVATFSLFLGSTFVTQTYPMLREAIGTGYVFLLYGVVMLPAAYFVWKFVPETKGRSLESIGQYWKKDTRRR